MIPTALARLGVVASAALSVLVLRRRPAGCSAAACPGQSPVTWFVWLPVLIFELSFAYWLLSKPGSLASRG